MVQGNPSNRADRISATLTAVFAPEMLRVTDDSAHHAGHVGAQGSSGQTHYNILLVSQAFRGMNRVARFRAVHAAMADEFGAVDGGGMHALTLTLRTPEEHAAASR
jgi:stress-induced morphogen